MTYTRFLERFPDNDACLAYLKDRYVPDGAECPKCDRESKFHRIKGRSAFSCQWCGHHVYPTAGTIFHKSTVNLQLWFYAIYLMSSTRCGVSAKQLEREIGVTYKTAHRMFKQIRPLLSDEDDDRLGGEGEKVEVDETFVGGKPRAAEIREGTSNLRRQFRPTVLGMVERGKVRARIIPDRGLMTLNRAVLENVLPASMLFTDDYSGYYTVARNYRAHHRINHSAKVYVDGDTHTNTIEGFFGIFKNSIRGTHHAISTAYLQNYLDEHVFRYNHRRSFDADVLGDAQPRRAALASFRFESFVVARSRSRRNSSSVWSGSCFSTTSCSGGVGAFFSGRLRAGLIASQSSPPHGRRPAPQRPISSPGTGPKANRRTLADPYVLSLHTCPHLVRPGPLTRT